MLFKLEAHGAAQLQIAIEVFAEVVHRAHLPGHGRTAALRERSSTLA